MSLVTDPAFLVYQLRVSFLRTNDPTGARVLTFDDLSVPHVGWGEQRGRQGSAASAMTPTGRRKTSASEIRQQVAQNATANAYIMARGHYPETEVAGSPEIEVNEGYQYSGAAAARSGAMGRSGAAGRKKRTNRNAKIAPTGAGGEQVVGLGVEPGQAEMVLDAAARRGLATEEAGDAGSQSDSAQTGKGTVKHWEPEPMPPRRSLDTIRQSDQTGSAAAVVRGRNSRHAHSSSMATIRLQRPHELLSRGSSRDAVALGIDFDVKSIFESEEDAERSSGDGTQDTGQTKAQGEAQSQTNTQNGAQSTRHAAREDRRLGMQSRQMGRGVQGRKKSGRRNDMSFRIPLGSLREERGGSALLKRSATLPAKRAGGGAAGGGLGQTSKWAGAYAAAGRRAGNQASGWVGGAPETSWDHSSGEEADDVTPLSRRTGTQTWYGPRGGVRPISMFPPAPIPPVPLMFGADDSDDDIDLEGDDGSSRTPAALGPGLQPRVGSRKGSAVVGVGGKPRAALGSTALGSTKCGHLAQDTVAMLAGGTHERLEKDVAARQRGSSDPEGRLALHSSRVQSGSSWHASENSASRPASNLAGAASSRNSGAAQPTLDNLRQGGRITLGRPPSGSEPPAVRDIAPAYVARPAPAVSGLAALLATRVDVRANVFSEEFGAVGAASGDSGTVELRVFVQGAEERSKARTVRVRGTATVEQAIGYVLHQHVEDGEAPTLAGDELDVVAWALRIFMDGEVDDDFPALDRSRPVANFAFDEFALCLAPPDHVRANEAARVRQGRPARMTRPVSLVCAPPPPQPTVPRVRELHCTVVPRVEVSAVVLQPSRIAIASTAGIFVGAAPPAAAASQSPPLSPTPAVAPLPHAPLRLLRIRVPGESAALRATAVEADAADTMRTVLARVCRKKSFAEDEYVLGLFESAGFVVCSSDMRVAQVPHDTELMLHRVGSALPSCLAPDLAPIYGRQQPVAVERLASAYHSFRVIRRAQMFSRHERNLVIDGATVTLMPAELRSDSAKSHTFHIANVVCKRNQKSPKKIRLFVSRRGNAADKSFDLEAISEEEAGSICSILLRLREHYSFSAM
ncbi:Component of a membrane-bound complex containing the Tor2p kinase [Coemansia sp. RSA 1365]|nr:Component of a membrane-bound complex containing the Tor2p kinase [Coemansia sp. RSA 1365]